MLGCYEKLMQHFCRKTSREETNLGELDIVGVLNCEGVVWISWLRIRFLIC
jgi:hypothetical protein